MRKENESGAIVVEATLSLTAFVFAIFTILSVVNICYIQAKMGVALDMAAKEMAQYSYLYFKIGVDELEAQLNEGTEEARDVSKQTIDGVISITDSLSEARNSAASGDFDSMIENINNGADSVESLYKMYGDKVASDPKQFIIGFGKMAGNEIKEEAKVYLAQVMAKGFMQKNLKANENDDADAFLRRYRVVNGMDGLDFKYTAMMAYGSSNKMQLVCTYKVKVLQLLNIDFEFQFRQIAKTNAWGNGVSLIKPELSTSTEASIWDNPNALRRGKLFVIEEKKKFEYTSSGNGYDAYVNKNGENEFISIVSHDTKADSYSTVSKLKDVLREDYNNLYGGVSKLGEDIKVTNKSGESVTLKSPPDTRTYVLRVVIPADSDMSIVNQAKKELEKELGSNVRIEFVDSYGSPKRETKK